MLKAKIETRRCAPKTYPCPHCGKKGRRVRPLQRWVRSLAYRRQAWLDIRYAEYKARCHCCKYFRSCPADVLPKADYDNLVRQAVLDRLLDDGLSVERTREALKRDFLLQLSAGYIYDCLDWQLRQINCPQHRLRTLQQFSGTLCIDELHLGRFTLLLATDPLADTIVGFALVRHNDQAHMGRFLRMLKHHGFLPRQVVSDGSNLYPTTLAEVWPQAKHQLCIFHILQDITDQVLDAVRRLRRKLQANRGRKRKQGRPKKGTNQRARKQGLTNKQQGAFVFKRRHLIVKRQENLTAEQRSDLQQMYQYVPELRILQRFSQEVYRLWNSDNSRKVARWRWTRIHHQACYQEIPELQQILVGLDEHKFEKTQAFLKQPWAQRVKTNNHVERTNRKLRFDEKVRYKFRKRQSVVRFVLLKISRYQSRPGPKAKPQNKQAQPKQTGPGLTAVPHC